MAIRLITGRLQQWSDVCKNSGVMCAGVLMIWNRSDMHLTSGEIQRRSCSRSVKSSAHGRHWLTQAQLTTSEIFETS